jgi:hypothetical protein
MSRRRGVEQFPVPSPLGLDPRARGRARSGPATGGRPYLPAQLPVIDAQTTLMTRPWLEFERGLVGAIAALEAGGAGGGITQLTGDVTAGPGSGSQAATLAASGATAGTYTNATVTVNAKGLVTSASSGSDHGITQLTGDVTAGPGDGSQAATIGAGKVTYAKMQNVSAASKLLGSSSTGSGAPPSEITLGSGLSMSGTTLSVSAGGGNVTGPASSVTGNLPSFADTTGKLLQDSGKAASALVTATGTPASGNLAKFSGATSVTNGDLTGDVTTAGALATTLAASGVTAGTYGDATHVARVTLDAKGRATGASAVLMADTVISRTDTGTVNDWAPGLNGHTAIMWTGTADLTITGIAGGVAGQRVTIWNNGGNNAVIYLLFQSASSLVGNRCSNYATSGPTPVAYYGSATYEYIGTAWVLVAHDQGAWIAPPFSAPNYAGTAGLSWSVAAGNVTLDRYCLRGRTLSYALYLGSTTLGGTPAGANLTRVAYGYTAVSNAVGAPFAANNAGVTVAPIPIASGTAIGLYRDPIGGTYTTGAFTIYGTSSIEVT